MELTPLENYNKISNGQHPTQSYLGDHRTILNLLGKINQQNVKSNEFYAGIWTRYPSLLINSTNDFKIKNDLTGKISTELILNATKVATQIYKNPEQSHKLIEEHRRYIETKVELKNLLNHKYKKIIDKATVYGNELNRSQKVSREIQNRFNGEDLLFLALGYGGTNPGLEIFTSYEQTTGSKNSQFYPIRFSRGKKEDKEPRLTKEEKQYLANLDPQRIILFDEDSSTGETIIIAKDHISRIFPNPEIVIAINYYMGQA